MVASKRLSLECESSGGCRKVRAPWSAQVGAGKRLWMEPRRAITTVWKDSLIRDGVVESKRRPICPLQQTTVLAREDSIPVPRILFDYLYIAWLFVYNTLSSSSPDNARGFPLLLLLLLFSWLLLSAQRNTHTNDKKRSVTAVRSESASQLGASFRFVSTPERSCFRTRKAVSGKSEMASHRKRMKNVRKRYCSFPVLLSTSIDS